MDLTQSEARDLTSSLDILGRVIVRWSDQLGEDISSDERFKIEEDIDRLSQVITDLAFILNYSKRVHLLPTSTESR